MTADRHELHDLVDELPDDQVALAMADVHRRHGGPGAGRTWPPEFFGIAEDKDARTDISERVDEVLAEGFGAPRP